MVLDTSPVSRHLGQVRVNSKINQKTVGTSQVKLNLRQVQVKSLVIRHESNSTSKKPSHLLSQWKLIK